MQEQKPFESQSAADFLQFALDNPLSPTPDETEDTDEKDQEPHKASETDSEDDEHADSESHNDEEDERDEDHDTQEHPDDEAAETTDEAADELYPEDVPELDPLLEDLAKGNPQAEKRVKEIAEGLQKLKDETKQLKSELESTKPRADTWDSYERALSDPRLAGPTLERLIEAVCLHHNVAFEDLAPELLDRTLKRAPQEQSTTDANGRVRPLWERRGYASEKEMQLEQQIRSMQGVIQQFQQAQTEIQKERAAAHQQAEFKNYIDAVAPRTIRQLEKLENGWKVTKAMVEKAIREFPQLKGEPARAVKAAFPDQLKSHYAKAASQARKQRGPEMLPDTRGKGFSTKPPLKTSAADVYAALGEGS